MWSSNGDIVGATVEVVDPGDMHVTGRIEDHSIVVLISTGGSITVDGKIDGNSSVTLKAAGNITIGTQGGDGDKKIDGNSNVTAIADGNIALGSYIHKATVDFSAHGTVTVGEIDYGAAVREIGDGDVTVKGKIDGASRVDLVSNRGSVMIDGKIDGESKVSLVAGQDVTIGLGQQGGDGDRKIDGNSFVVAMAGGKIALGGGVYKDHTVVDLAASAGVSVAKDISGGPTVRLLSGAGSITVADGIADSSTHVTSWPSAPTPANVSGGATVTVPTDPWAPPGPLALTAPRDGHWWENWSQTFGYVAPFRVVPRSLQEIVKAVAGTGRRDRTPVKAVGGGWSFTDAALPFTTQSEVDQASLRLRGAWQRQDIRSVLEGRTDGTCIRPMDLWPSAVARNDAFSTSYDQTNLRQVTRSGIQLPASGKVRIVDTRSLASSLHCEFPEIRAANAGAIGATTAAGRPQRREILFHVEAGITMADLQQLLDHQHPRLALRASGGSPGATLAGALSTATHGGEFRWPLLVDCVRAVHLVGPGGEQWWIEGDVPVADQAKLQQRYPAIDPAHFIAAGWSGISGLGAQDVLEAVTVSMGSMGVIYSMVVSVVPQFGLRQVVHPTTWSQLLSAASAKEQDLRAGTVSANQAVLDALIDGNRNGTGIDKSKNVYVDLAVNPINGDCWVVNRELAKLPDDANSPAPALGDFMTALSLALAPHAADIFGDSKVTGRLFDFLSWGTSISDLPNNLPQGIRLANFVTRVSDPLVGACAVGTAQTVLNLLNASGHADRGHQFIGDVLTGFFHALEGTARGLDSDHTGVSYEVGAIGWPGAGLPGRGLEIALDPANAFTFLQTVLFDDVLANTMTKGNNPLIGYISVRVCPKTSTLLGMQQFDPSVMIEVVSYRSPEANAVMDEVQAKAIAWTPPTGSRPLLHWGLENDQVNAAFLAAGPLGQTYKPGFTRLDAFKQIRQYLRNGRPAVFDNVFTARIGV